MAGSSESGRADAEVSHIARLAVAPGAGRVARRERALLFLPDGASADVLERFRRSEHGALAELITEHVLDDPDAIPAFVFIEWPNSADTARIQVIVRGDVEVVSDLDSMPLLSGAGSATWVEHRVARTPDVALFQCGAPVDADTDLSDGLVRGDGFELQIALRPQTQRPADHGEPPSADRPSTGRPEADPPLHPAGLEHEQLVRPVERDTPDRLGRLDRIASLAAAGGGDMMNEPVEPGGVPSNPGQAGVPHERHEETLSESALGSQPDPLKETVARRVLPEIELPDGSRHSVRGTTVLGRQPDGEAARAPDAVVIRLDAAPSVSRTHLRISLDGPQLFATDCSSSGGTVLVPAGDLAPIHLEPWMSLEVGNGDRLYLGGRETSLAIHDN